LRGGAMMAEMNARLENPALFGIVVGVLYFSFRVAVAHSSPAAALVSAFYIAAFAVLVRLVMNRMRAVRK
jgi:hypothetical protein